MVTATDMSEEGDAQQGSFGQVAEYDQFNSAAKTELNDHHGSTFSRRRL